MGRGFVVTLMASQRTEGGPGDGISLDRSVVTLSRRTMLYGSLLAGGADVATGRAAAADEAAKNLFPQPGDLLVLADSDSANAPLKPADLKLGADPYLAWAFDPKGKIVRDGQRFNQVLLMRFDPASLSEREKKWAAEGVVAYSAICTHQGCTVTYWLAKEQVLECPCHQSRYDARNGAQVVAGPAPRALPALPLRVANGVLVVAAAFTSRVGPGD